MKSLWLGLTLTALLGLHAGATNPRRALSFLVQDSSLSPSAATLVYLRVPKKKRGEVTLADMVLLQPKHFRSKSILFDLPALGQFLANFGLRMAMTVDDVIEFRKTGTLPPLNPAASIDDLTFSIAAIESLKNCGILLVEDLKGLTAKEVKSWGLEGDVQNEIVKVLGYYGLMKPATCRQLLTEL